MAHDSLATLLNLQQQDPLLSVPRRPLDYKRNQAKVASLRAFLGIPGEDVGDISQQDYEEAATDVERRRHAEIAAKGQADILPEVVRGQYGVQAARERARTDRASLQEDRQAFQAAQAELNRAAAAERQQAALDAPVVPTLDPRTGLAMWTPRTQAGGLRTGGSATERTDIQTGAGTLDNIGQLLEMGDAIGWKGIGPTGGARSSLYKFFGVGDPREDDFRTILQKVRADIMFGSGGKQLTQSEQKVAAGYLADIYTNPKAAKSRLLDIQTLMSRAQARRMGTVPSAPVEDEWEDVAR